MRVVVALALALAASRSVAEEAPFSRRPILVVGMCLDPSLLERNGISVSELNVAAEGYLRAAGVPIAITTAPPSNLPRASISVAVVKAGEKVVAFIEVQYQQPARLEESPDSSAYATTWRRWWGTTCLPAALPGELRRGIETLFNGLAAEYRRPQKAS